MEKTKVLFIASNGRSGSTILNVILGQLNGFFAGGELRRIWDRGAIENRLCGCGSPFQEGHSWNEIYETAFGKMDISFAEKIVGYHEKFTQTKHLAWMVPNKNSEHFRDPVKKDFVHYLGLMLVEMQK